MNSQQSERCTKHGCTMYPVHAQPNGRGFLQTSATIKAGIKMAQAGPKAGKVVPKLGLKRYGSGDAYIPETMA